MASPVQISSYSTPPISSDELLCKERSQTNDTSARKVASSPSSEESAALASPAIIAHSLEFVALPGRAEGIQVEIPMAMRHAFRDTDGFMGSMVLVSEQESRLVTIITLWTGSNRIALCGEGEARLRRWLTPYVDRSVRTRRFASFVAAPDRLPARIHPKSQVAGRENSIHLQ
ncbi:MAG TPA: hypothetical protein VMJ35_01960 [Dongiaceae bacterium]|nr:hypothetical protein [Dongiaceae bacterium]